MDETIYRKKHLTGASYLVAVLLFLLPFVEIRCNDQPLATNTGVGLAFGLEWKEAGQIKAMTNTFDGLPGANTMEQKKDSDAKIYVLALIALVLGIAGLMITVTTEFPGKVNTIIGVLAAMCLFGVMIHLNIDIKDRDEGDSPYKATAHFTPWYYISTLCFLLAAFFNNQRRKALRGNDNPPRNAPQLPIENPGDQSEFPKAASESELG